MYYFFFFFFSSRRRHTRFDCDWSSDVCSSDLFAQRQQVDAERLVDIGILELGEHRLPVPGPGQEVVEGRHADAGKFRSEPGSSIELLNLCQREVMDEPAPHDLAAFAYVLSATREH